MRTEYVLLASCLVVVAGVLLQSPSFLVVFALPASLLIMRLGSGSGSSISFADIFLILGTLAALPLMRWDRAGKLKTLIALAACYFAAVSFSVLANPNKHDILEWFHQVFMVVGAMIVGFVIVHRGRARLAATMFMVGSAALAIWTLELAAIHGFQPPYVASLGITKNNLGDMLAAAVILAQVRPAWVGLTSRWVTVVKYLALAGLLASQSRQAIVAAVVTVVVVMLRERRRDPRQNVVLVALVPLVIFAYVTITDEVTSHAASSSWTSRTASFSQTLQIWHTSPWFGVGERFWDYHQLYPGALQPPNAEVGVLATGGIVGLVGFVVLIIGALRVLWRLPKAAGTLGFAMLLAHVIQGQFDIFWVTATGSLPWIFVGMSVAATYLGEQSRPPPVVEATSAPPGQAGVGPRSPGSALEAWRALAR